MPTDSNDDATSRQAGADGAGEIVRAKAERLDKAEPAHVVGNDDAGLRGEVAALKKQLQRNQRTMIIVVPTLVLLVLVFMVVALTMFAPQASTEGSASSTATTATTTATTTTTSSSTALPSQAPTTTSPVATTTAPATAATPKRVPAPEVFLSGQHELGSDWIFDLDDGSEWSSIGDIVHDGEAVSGHDGAVIALGRTADDEYTRCATVPKADYRSHIPFAEFVDNPILCVRTDEGRLAYLELTSFPDSNGGDDMTFRWTTWKK
ncbi:MAG TPA: hypothetical protein VH969_01755 [Actinophytocola sp.]|uniref:hypothetical protein n=1 Tax=Actinophytocola sp. TaxID=1872138 RepID=UPI002F958852